MSRHTITYDEISDYLSREVWSMAACSGGSGTHKRLEASTKGTFRVTDQGKVIYQGANLGIAVEAYNDAP